MKHEPQQTVPDVICICVHSSWRSAWVFIDLSFLRVIMVLHFEDRFSRSVRLEAGYWCDVETIALEVQSHIRSVTYSCVCVVAHSLIGHFNYIFSTPPPLSFLYNHFIYWSSVEL